MKKLVIFDLDGTLLDTIGDLATSVNHALRLHGFPDHPLEAYRYFVGNGARELIARALPKEHRNDETIDRLREDFKKHYSSGNDIVLTKPYPGISELVNRCRENGVEMAVASNKYQLATDKLTRYYFGDDVFRIILGQREGIPVKPDPAIVHEILDQTGYTPQQVLYVGDSGVDMQTAERSGLESVGVTWGFRPREELMENGANNIVDHADDIWAIIER